MPFRVRALIVALFSWGLVSAAAPAATAATLRQAVLSPEENDYGVISLARLARSGEAEALAKKAGRNPDAKANFSKFAPTHARLAETVELYVKNLDLWLVELERKKAPTPGAPPPAWETETVLRDLIDARLPQLRLVLNGHLLSTVPVIAPAYRDPHSEATRSPKNPAAKKSDFYDCVRFQLTRDSLNPASRADWAEILKESRGDTRMDVTLALLGADGIADIMPSWIQRGQHSPDREFRLLRLPWDRWLVGGAAILLAALLVFIYLARETTLVREISQPKCPDGLPPYSLGRCQMAFWFFFTAAAFFFLWLVTGRGDPDTLNSETLSLIGISTATGLGAAALAAKEAARQPAPGPEALTAGEKLTEKKLELQRLEHQRKTESDPARRAELEAAVAAAKQSIATWTAEIEAWRKAHPFRFINDLITEDFTGNVVSFHRFQIVVWTLVLGVVFVSEVWTRLAMPRFDTTLLLLMGLSSGTYLAGKVSSKPPE